LLDASQIFAGEAGELYYDHCHFGKRGNELLLATIVRAVVETPPPDHQR
jgi:hypothetical protein